MTHILESIYIQNYHWILKITKTSVYRPRQNTSGDVKVPMTQDAKTISVNAIWRMYISQTTKQLGPEHRRETVLCGSSPTIGSIGLDDTKETDHQLILPQIYKDEEKSLAPLRDWQKPCETNASVYAKSLDYPISLWIKEDLNLTPNAILYTITLAINLSSSLHFKHFQVVQVSAWRFHHNRCWRSWKHHHFISKLPKAL